jgi:hypothetical protein
VSGPADPDSRVSALRITAGSVMVRLGNCQTAYALGFADALMQEAE